MIKYVFILTLSLFFSEQAFCQQFNCFSKRIDNFNADGVAAFVEVDEGLIFTGSYSDVGITKKQLLFKTDTLGNVIWKRSIGSQYYNHYTGNAGSLKITSDNNLAFIGSRQDSLDNVQVVLSKFSLDGDMLWMNYYGDTVFDGGADVVETKDHGFLMVGQAKTSVNGLVKIVLIKTDSIGNQEWYKVYSSTVRKQGEMIKATNDGGYVISGEMDVSTGTNVLFSPFILKIDSIGNIKWSVELGSPYNDGSPVVLVTKSGNYLVGYVETLNPNAAYNVCGKTTLVMLDPLGNILWKKYYGEDIRWYINVRNVIELPNNDFLIAGTTADTTLGKIGGNYQGIPEGYILRVNENGDSLHYETHEYLLGTYSENYFSDIIQTESGSVYVCGHVHPWDASDTGTQDAWLVKLNPEGICDTINSIEKRQEGLFSVYPNPFSQNLTIKVPFSSIGYKVIIYNALGMKLFETEIHGSLEVNNNIFAESKGIFFVKFYTTNELINVEKIIRY